MQNKRYKKENKGRVGKLLIAIIIISVIAISSFATVMANTVPCTVVDGDESYEFSLISPKLEDILAKAQEEGMEPLSADDKVHGEKGQLVIDRALTLSLVKGNEHLSLIAYKGDVLEDVLVRSEVEFDPRDKIEPELDTVISEDTNVGITAFTPAVVWVDKVGRRAELYGGTVADALSELNIKLEDEDKIEPELDTPLTKDMFIHIETAKDITVTDGGKPAKHRLIADTVEDALKRLKLKLGENDIVKPDPTTAIKDGTKITIDRISYAETVETEAIPFDTVYEDDSSMEQGTTAVSVQGAEGSMEVSYRETYVNGELSERTATGEKILAEPVNQLVLNGTKEPEPEIVPEAPAPDNSDQGGGSTGGDSASGNTFVDGDGNTVSYSNVMVGECTAYTDPGGITSLGNSCQVGVVAVNPDVIPYGTRMYITSGSVVYGYAIAGDTGGAALSNRILVDVYYDSESEVYNFGRRDMTVYILD